MRADKEIRKDTGPWPSRLPVPTPPLACLIGDVSVDRRGCHVDGAQRLVKAVTMREYGNEFRVDHIAN